MLKKELSYKRILRQRRGRTNAVIAVVQRDEKILVELKIYFNLIDEKFESSRVKIQIA